MPRLSIIIPAYNEERALASTVRDYVTFFRKKKESFEVLLIPNHCSDRTPEIAKELKQQYPEVRVHAFTEKIGKGGAIIEGFRRAHGDFIAYVDADNSLEPEALFTIFQHASSADCVMGSRWLPSSIIPRKQPFLRRIASRGFNTLVRFLLGLRFTDTQCGGKCFKRRALQTILPKLKNEGWAFDVGVLYLLHKNKFTIKEIPITWKDNPNSHLNMVKVIPRMFLSLLKIRFRR